MQSHLLPVGDPPFTSSLITPSSPLVVWGGPSPSKTLVKDTSPSPALCCRLFLLSKEDRHHPRAYCSLQVPVLYSTLYFRLLLLLFGEDQHHPRALTQVSVPSVLCCRRHVQGELFQCLQHPEKLSYQVREPSLPFETSQSVLYLSTCLTYYPVSRMLYRWHSLRGDRGTKAPPS